MKRILLASIYVITVCSFAQTVNFQGQILDKNTNAPVVFANLSFLNSEKGVSTNRQGVFTMNVKSELLETSLHISNLNYHDTVVKAANIQDKILYLRPKIELLEEVTITPIDSKQIEIDRPKGTITNLHSQGIRMIAKYFPNTKLNDCCKLIEKVEVFFPKRRNKKSKFRFRIFDKDPRTGLPNSDLLKVNIPVEVTAATQHISLDLSNYLIEMPEHGFFIAFEKLLIPYNAYSKNQSNQPSEIFYSPVLGWSKSKLFKNTTRNFLFVKGKWVSLGKLNKGRARGYVPSISVTLTN